MAIDTSAEPQTTTNDPETPLFDVKTPAFKPNTKIAVLCGGLSSEREVSLRSGKNCYEALKRLGYTNVVLIDVNRKIASRLKDERVEAVFLATHGKYGEDGCIQGLLEMMGLPYTGNDVRTSALTMDKAVTKTLLKAAGLPVLESTLVQYAAGKQQPLASIHYTGDYPVMVKPLGEGSSVGMSKVLNTAELETALQQAAKYSATVMIEPFITGKDLTVGVVDVNGQPVVTPILELKPKEGWYDEKAKYTPGLTEFILPAAIDTSLTKAIQDTTVKAHEVLGCKGVSRTDYVVDAEGRFYILEVNTIPGMTDLSDLPAQAKAMGMSYDQLVHQLLQSAASRVAVSGKS